MRLSKTPALGLVALLATAPVMPAQTVANPPSVTEMTGIEMTGIKDLATSLQITALMAQLREEGLDGAAKVAESFQIDPSGSFQFQLERLFDPQAMEAVFLATLNDQLGPEPKVLQATLAFYSAPLGQKAVTAELAARAAMQATGGEDAAKAAYKALSTDDPARRDLIDRMIAEADLIEFNVMGGLNSNLAFMQGLAATGALGDLPESEMLAQVWNDEATMRSDSAEWLTGFLTLAYSDLTADELVQYADFLGSAQGKRLNAALFASFDGLYAGLSQEQGRIVGRLMQGDNI